MSTKAYYIPNGPSNLASLFPDVDFSTLDKYYIEIQDSNSTVLATSTINQMGKCCDDKHRIHFLNYLGAIDAINFKRILNEHEATSSKIQYPTRYPLVKSQHSNSRFNVKANDLLTLSNRAYNESDMDWFQELIDSPIAFLEWTGTQGQSNSYIPVVIEDGKMDKMHLEDRFVYEVIIQVKLSHEKFIIRN